MPAEWTRHQATWLTWPHNEETWPDCLDGAREAFAEMIRVIGHSEQVELLIASTAARDEADLFLRRRSVDLAPVRFHCVPTDDSWIRDYGPIFVADGSQLTAIDWRFNSWGEKYALWNNDDAAGSAIARLAGCRVDSKPTVLEGGSIDVDGAGALLTTRQNVYASSRGPGRDDEFFETVRGDLGVSELIMLGDGIDGDDTDGHVDDIARFAPNQTIVAAVESDRGDVNYEPLAENREILNEASRRTGHQVVELPMPDPVFDEDGTRLPASYANFYVANAGVLVPTFSQAKDAAAIAILETVFRDRPVIGIDARTLVIGRGACHCLTMQQPAT